MASLNSSTHVHTGSEGSFSRRKVDPRSPGGAARQERSRAAVVVRAVRCGRVHRQLAGGTVEAARTTRCRATVVLRAVCGSCGHRRLARRDGGVVRPSSRGQFAAAARSPSACRRQLARLDAVVSCAKIGRSAASARIRTIRLRQSRAKVWQVIGGPMSPRSP